MVARREHAPPAIIAGLALLLAACGDGAPTRFGEIDAARVLAADSQPQNWLTSGRDAGKTHFSPLRQINQETVGRLGFAWAYETGTNRVLEATPIVVDGVMYASGPMGRVWALDARNGTEIWRFDPMVDGQVNRRACCDQANRGVAVWKGRVYVASLDGVLYALSAETGAVQWQTDTIYDRRRGYTVTGAPEVAGNAVVIGSAGDELDVRGYLTAYDLDTGAQKWRFFTIPGDPAKGPDGAASDSAMEIAARTWSPSSRWDIGGGGAPWDAIHYDPKTGLLFVGTGNGGPYSRLPRDPSGGDDLFLCSILALDPDTGRLVWYHQQTPGDQWDMTATQPMVFTDLTMGGKSRPVLLHAPKNGFFYIYDRRDGTLLAADQYARVNWAKSIDLRSGRPIEDAEAADYSFAPKLVAPATFGAHNWNPMAYSPDTGLVYIPAMDSANLLATSSPKPVYRPGLWNPNVAVFFMDQIAGAPESLPPAMQKALAGLIKDKDALKQGGVLRAWDPIARKIVWEVPTTGWWDHAGVLATGGGLVFQGSSNGNLRIFDDRTGKLLKEIDTGSSILAAPMTYRIGGEQYVAVMAAWGGGGFGYSHPTDAFVKHGNMGRILTFKLGGGATPKPAELPAVGAIPAPPAQSGSPAQIALGAQLYGENCALCHSNLRGAITPDLRRMSAGTHGAFLDIVGGGVLKAGGMPGWGDVMTPAQIEAIHAYLISIARAAYEAEQRALKEGKTLQEKPGSFRTG
jgi:quinohemoprotein ethanol dehydrogenase